MLGLGIMGSAMAANLLRAGFKVIGYDPVAACRTRHRKAGGILAASAQEVARSARIVISSLPSAAALAAVAREISGERNRNLIVIETSTLPIPVKEAARKRVATAGAAQRTVEQRRARCGQTATRGVLDRDRQGAGLYDDQVLVPLT